MSMFKTALAGVVLSAGVIISLGASAHPKLLSSTPDSGAQGAAPAVIELRFSENLLTQFSGAKLIMTAMPGMPNHGEMPIRNFTPSWSADGTTLTLTLKKPLPTGTYDLRWQAAGADGQAMSGKVSFDVG